MPIPKIMTMSSALGAGVGEVVVQRIDAQLGRTQPFRRIVDFYHLGLLTVGAVGAFMDAAPDITEPLFLVGLYASTKSIGEALLTLGAGEGAGARGGNGAGNRAAIEAARQKALAARRDREAGRYPAPTREEEFVGVRLS